jgi:drug/metabolite transporter (DMT)-like permease
MVVLGSVIALRLRDSLPLTIYLWAFFPALGAVLTVSAGQQLTHDHGVPGLFLLWGGVAGLGAYTCVEFSRLSRH